MRSRTWFLLSLLLMAAAVWFWQRGDEAVARRDAERRAAGQAAVAPAPAAATNNPPAAISPTNLQPVNLPAGRSNVGVQPARAAVPPPAVPAWKSQFPYRLGNTTESMDQLGRSDTAILLENAFLDTANPAPLEVPEHLRSDGDPGSYVVQSRGPIDPAFYDRLREAGAEFISYIPNNAALVRVSAEGARELAGLAGSQAVLPYEPYYKLAYALLPRAVEREPIPLDQRLNLVLFPGERESVLAALPNLGAETMAEDRTPFGPLITIRPHPDTLEALAKLTGVQRIEYASPRGLVNDLTRPRIGVGADPVTTTNHLSLSGSNVLVNINDTGVDAAHPDLQGRVFSTDPNPFTLIDFEGHGTHVAGTIASSGSNSPALADVYLGSLTNSNFRGMAPASSLFVLPIDLRVGPLISDSYLQETAARENYLTRGKTNALISNNSWGYVNAFEYNALSASYDAAVRDALPAQSGSQPILYVFAAGNNGAGLTNGIGGDLDSIIAPATAKNVITVGAIEKLRNITNEFYTTELVNGTNVTVTNVPFLGMTDSDHQVATFSSRGNVGVGREGEFGRVKPDVVAPGSFVVSTRSSSWELETAIPPTSPLFPMFEEFTTNFGPYYRFESGTSMAAPAVSGALALMQQFFEEQLKRPFSPALMKALLINGARNVNPTLPGYDLQARKALNYQGWGLMNLSNSLPAALTNTTDESTWPVRMFDQSPTNAIATGQRHTWNLGLSTNAVFAPLRVTLVWTDPPGNPGAAIKLVNDLDLVVTNLVTGEVFVGNNIPQAFDYNVPNGTNGPPEFDFINNVENVFLSDTLDTNYSISVIGRRVNVNAVTANVTDVVQDYALVISSGNGEILNPFDSLARSANGVVPRPALVGLTNGLPLLNERVGANFQLLSSTNGNANQWRFYVFTNFSETNFTSLEHGSNVAFATFIPPNLARPRNLEADIDLYVSQDSRLTNLDPAVVAASFKSLRRGGTEVVVFTNAAVSVTNIYYIGVKSEDQQGGEYGLVGLSTDLPFDEDDGSGNRILRGLPPNVLVPDGSPSQPGAALVFAIGTFPQTVARVIVTNDLTHQSIGDLLGNLSHEDQFAVLNNHNRFGGTTQTNFLLAYDDSSSGQFFNSLNTDGPGSLTDFIGTRSEGLWLLTMEDNSLNRTGMVNNLTLRVEPQPILTDGVSGSVLPNQFTYYFIDVPADAVSMTITLSSLTPALPLNLYVKQGAQPTTTDYDKSALIDPPGGTLTVGIRDVPPLNPGRWFIGVFNPNPVPVSYNIQVTLQRDLASVLGQTYTSSTTIPNLVDDSFASLSLLVTNNRPVTDLQVGLRVNHPRVSDLVFHLISPQGTRVLLAENRGGNDPRGYGGGSALLTNFSIVYTTGFESVVPTNYLAGSTFDGWTVDANAVTVRSNTPLAHTGQKFLALRNGRISRVLPTTAGRSYRLRVAYRLNLGVGNGIIAWWSGIGNTASDISGRGYNGTPQNGVTFPPGVVDEAFGFDGVDDRIDVPDTAELDLTGDYTIEMWVNPSAVQKPFATIVRKEAAAFPSGFGIAMDGSTNSNFYYAGWKNAGSLPGDECWTTAGFQLTPGVWQHLAVVKSGATRSVYVDGVIVGTAACTSTNAAVGQNNALLQFGAWTESPGTEWAGMLDEMSIYNRALNAGQIEDIVVSGSGGKCANAITPVTCSSATAIVTGSISNVVGGWFEWLISTTTFTAPQDGTVLVLDGIIPGMVLDTIELLEIQVINAFTYTTFTENTNLTQIPIKFATPPFTNTAVSGVMSNLTLVNDGFEGIVPGVYPVGSNIGGWLVSQGSVTIHGPTNSLGVIAHQGTNFVELGDGGVRGGISTNVATQANRRYVVRFAARHHPLSISMMGGEIISIPNRVLFYVNGQPEDFAYAVLDTWQTNVFVYAATGPSTTFELRCAEETLSPLIDSVEIIELVQDVNAYYLPEESLKPFFGESAFGTWQLEVWDNRVGAFINPVPVVQSWQLTFTFARTNPPATRLTFCPATTNVASVYDNTCNVVTNTVAGGEIKYFIVEVPRRATAATNILSVAGGSGLWLYYNSTGLPEGNSPPDDVFPIPVLPPGGAALTLTTSSVPPLRPGQRYYLGVANLVPTETNLFAISVAFDQVDTNLINVITLTNAIGYTNTIQATNALDYYRFVVSPGATLATFELFPQNGDVNLLVRKEQPVLDPLPAPVAGKYDYISQNPGTNSEQIFVTGASVPVPLGPGVWYLGVFNMETNPVAYTIRATETTTNSLYTIITLTNDVPLDFAIPAGAPITNYFLFSITQPSPSVLFELYNLTGAADLLVDVGLFPTPTSFLTFASGGPGSPAEITLVTNSIFPDLRGDWYLAVDNQSGANLGFTIKASIPLTNIITINPQIIITNGMLCLSWNSIPGTDYYVESKTNLLDPVWTAISPTITATDVITTYCVPMTGTQQFFRVVQGTSPLGSGTVVVTAVTFTGTSFVLTWTASPADRFQVEYATSLPPTWTTIPSIVTSSDGNFIFVDDGSQTGGLGSIRFYRLLRLP